MGSVTTHPASDVTTERLVLHPFTAAEARRVATRAPLDADLWHPEYPTDDEVDVLLLFTTDPTTPFTLYAICERETNLAIGGIGFFGSPDATGTVEIGYGLVPSAQGKGYATEAVRATLLIAASNGAERVKADTLPVNIASQNVMLKAGFLEQHRTDETVYYAFEIGRELSTPR